MTRIYQQTLQNDVSCKGIGLHSGTDVRMTLAPAPVNSGIRFIRSDIPGEYDPVVYADYRHVSNTNLGTTLTNGDGTMICTVEHLMAALWGCGVDNAVVRLDGPEVPIMDGSAEPFVFLIECAGVQKQSEPRTVYQVLKRVEVQDEGKHIAVMPSHNFSVSLEIAFDDSVVSTQRGEFDASATSFRTDFCRARTFGFERDVSRLKELGLAKGGSLNNAVVVGNQGVLNEDGLRYQNEFVRHKILDCIGDLYLAGAELLGRVEATRSGHKLNHLLLQTLFADQDAWKEVRLNAPVAVS